MRKRKGTLTRQEAKKSFYYHYLYSILDYLLALWFWRVYIFPQDKGIKLSMDVTSFFHKHKILAGKTHIQVQLK